MTSPTILVVDDDPLLRDGLALALREAGYRLLMAGSAVEALVHLSSGPVDVVLSDQRMPGLDGLELLQIVRDRFPDTVRVVLTGHLDEAAAFRAMHQGEIYRPLRKPVDPFELKVTLHLALEKLALERENHRLAGIVRSSRDRAEG